MAGKRRGAGREPDEPWRRVEVVAACGPEEAAQALRRALGVLAEAFDRWLRSGQDAGHASEDGPPAEPGP